MAEIYLTPNTAKLFRKIKDQKIKTKIKAGFKKLSQDPHAGKKLRGELEGQNSLRIWPYRIVYYVTEDKNITVTDIGHRKDIYR